METLSHFLHASPTPYHAVANMEAVLRSHDFIPLKETDPWHLQPGGRYYVLRERSALVAFIMPQDQEKEPEIRLVAAHTDSPGLKLKPRPFKRKGEDLVWDVEIYGSPILSTWFDRDLGVAGMVTLVDGEARIRHLLLEVSRVVAMIPNLAIHLNSKTNNGYKVRRHEELSPVVLQNISGKGQDSHHLFQKWLEEALAQQYPELSLGGWHPVAWDLSLYDLQPPAFLEGGWLMGGRLDNLLSCFAGLGALTTAGDKDWSKVAILPVLACFNHEEIGSQSYVGAMGNLTQSVLGRLFPDVERYHRIMAGSLMASVDNAHGLHPNYADKHDGNHVPELNAGVVFKHNANQRYAHSMVGEGQMKGLCRRLEIPWQDFAMRADMACGSTIGPILSARLGLRAMDLGVATWAMHSIRETAGLRDIVQLQTLLTGFFTLPLSQEV